VGAALVSTSGDDVSCGVLSVLGVDYRLLMPAGVSGRVTGRLFANVREPHVDHGARLLELTPLADANSTASAAQVGANTAAGLVFRAPMSGRFYLRAAPDKPPFAALGDMLTRGQTVCLLEVMKTFNRLALSGDDLPERVRVVQVVPADGEDVTRGDVLLRLEPA
jgi:biotin carboxyl carrier protein